MTTLRKFEHQTGLQATLQMQGHGLPLAPDMQVQVLHIVQEALSNVRKHAARQPGLARRAAAAAAGASRCATTASGFAHDDGPPDETHVGLRIMAERAERIGARSRCCRRRGAAPRSC